MGSDSYLSERKYEKETVNPILPEQWIKIMGEESLQLLCREYAEIASFLNGDNRYSLKDEFKKNEYNILLSIYKKNLFSDEEINVDRFQNKLFSSFYIPFIQLAQYYGKSKYGLNIKKYFSLGIQEDLFENLSAICTRILVNEIQALKEKLVGGNRTEKYKYYVSQYLSDKSYVNEILDKYPIMLRCILDRICSTLFSYNDFLNKWNKDVLKIRDRIGCSSTDIIGLKRVGDIHRQGQSAIKISLKEGNKIFYKPRSLKIAKTYYKVFEQISKSYGLQTYDYQIIDMGEYGWEGEVNFCPCNNEEEVKRFYIRMGIHIMISYILDVQDLHYENLIAHGEYPVFIDIENICGNIVKYNAELTADEKAGWKLSSSILGNGILSCDSGRQDLFCALTGKGGIQTGWKTWKVVNAMTSDIKLEYVESETAEGKNIPFLGRKKCKYEKYANALYFGFMGAYLYAYNNKEILEKQFRDFEARLLITSTQKYAKIIQLSYHPMFMIDGGARQLILSQDFYLRMNDQKKTTKEVLESELQSLINGDIPYFTFKTNETQLILESNKSVPNYFCILPEEYIKIRLENLSLNDLKFQKKLLLKVTGYKRESSKKRNAIISKNKNDILYICNEIGKYIEKKGIKGNYNDISWITCSGPAIHVLDMYLYEGISGLAVFFAALNRINNSDHFQTLEKMLISRMLYYTYYEKVKDNYSGAYCGEASIVYSYLLLYKIKGEKDFIKHAEMHEEKLSKLIQKDNDFDLLYGNAGAVIIYINLYKVTAKETYLFKAQTIADYLVEKGRKTLDGIYWNLKTLTNYEGLAHGGSGFALCFTRLYEITHDLKYLNIAIEAVSYENKLYDKNINNWVDQDHKSMGNVRAYWCHGAGGIALVREELKKHLTGSRRKYIYSDYLKAIKKLEDIMYTMNNLCLCHGAVGNMMILRDYQEEDGFKKDYQKLWAENHILRGLGVYCDDENIGFMTGLSGIGYGLLYIFYNEQNSLPNILKLEI